MKSLTLIIPCYNEEGHLYQSYKKVKDKLLQINIPYKMLFIDDKSKDNTLEVIQSICKADKNCEYILHKKNVGRGGTVSEGVIKSKTDYVGFIDIDLEISESYISKFLEKLEEGYDLVIANRSYPIIYHAIFRIISSKIYIYLRNLLLPLPVHDTEAGYKFFNRGKILPILKITHDKKWFWDTEIIIKSYYNDLTIHEVPVKFIRRRDKKSTVRLVYDSWEYVKCIFKLKKELHQNFSLFFYVLRSYQKSISGMVYFLLKWYMFPFRDMDRILPKSGTIVDVGCGEGVMSRILAFNSAFRSVIGIDNSNVRTNIAKSKVKIRNLKFAEENAITFNYSKCKGVVMSDFLHHVSIEDQEKIVHKLCKATLKNGVLLVKEVDSGSKIRKTLSRFWDYLLYPHDKINYRSKEEWKTLLERNGMKVETRTVKPLSPFSTVLIIGRKK